jgi:arginine decarboxylase
MKIIVTTGVGTGPTELAAFDTALLDAGVANYNLIPLSSVIPPGSVLKREKYVTPENEYGHRLYVVMSQQETSEPGEEAWAGVGWTQDDTGKGLFVEHHGSSEIWVKEAIYDSLRTMMANRNDYVDCPIYHEIVGVRCADQPVSAVAIAVYESQEW